MPRDTPSGRRGVTPSRGRRYTEDEKKIAIAQLLANSGNITKTARETGISREKLREWQSAPVASSPEIAALKKDLTDSYRAKLRQAREAALDRMLELIPQEFDLHKVTGAAKILSELNITEEVADDFNRPSAGVPAPYGAAADADAPAPRLN